MYLLELLEAYNKWLKRGKIPSDKNYTVIVPVDRASSDTPYHDSKKSPVVELPSEVNQRLQEQYPIIDGHSGGKNVTIAHKIKVNGLKGIIAAQGYTVQTLAEKGGLAEAKFRSLNDMSQTQKLVIGDIYYLQRKRARAKFYYHTVQAGESMWSISQKYGLKLHKLYRKNRMKDPATPAPGRVLWLRLNRPASVPVEYKSVKQASVSIQADPKNLDTNLIINKDIISKKETTTMEANAEKIEKPENYSKTNDSTQMNPAIFSNDKGEETTVVEDTTTENLQNESVGTITPVEVETLKTDELQGKTASPTEQQPKLMPYTIKKGDTFFSISNRFNMRISDLLSYNELSIRDTLSINQKILVNYMEFGSPKNQPNTIGVVKEKDVKTLQEDTKHKVSPGETLYSLAKKYNVSLNDLLLWNDKDNYDLKNGEIIIIKSK